jgi:hypothetical protein
MYLAVVSLRPMFSQFILDNNNATTTRTNLALVTGRWWLSGEPEQVHKN